jgi:hypothetical protein
MTVDSGATARKPRDVAMSPSARCTRRSGWNQVRTPAAQSMSYSARRTSPTVVAPGVMTALDRARATMASVTAMAAA